jgi:hypothetical protein
MAPGLGGNRKLLPLAIIFAVSMSSAAAPAPFNFSYGYAVWVASYQGKCNYFLTDVGEDAQQLTHTLRENYDVTKGLEVLTSYGAPIDCAAKAVHAARLAGFRRVRIRPGTDKDRSPGIP